VLELELALPDAQPVKPALLEKKKLKNTIFM
jgi:hypothetical protein